MGMLKNWPHFPGGSVNVWQQKLANVVLGCFDLTDVLSLAWQIAKLEIYFILFFVDLKISLESYKNTKWIV